MDEFRRQGGFFLSKEESDKLGRFILRPNGTMNPQIVGKDAQTLAKLAGLNIPSNVKVLLSEQNTVSKTNPYSREKLTTILAFYVEENAEKACERFLEIHPDNKYRELITYMLDFAKKEINDRVLS